MLNESKFSMPFVHCAFGKVSRPIFLRVLFKHFMKKNRFKVLFVPLLENNVSTARTLRVIGCTLTFYFEICEIPRLFLKTKSLETNSETSFETQIFETDTETFF